MGAAERWERRPVLAAVMGPPHAGLPWLRRHLARHPLLAVPAEASGFWTCAYPTARPDHWGQAFAGLRGRIRVDVDEGLATLPHWKSGALAAAHPKIRLLYVLRNPVARSWDALRAFHARHGDELRLGDGLGWIGEVLRTPDEFRGHDLGLLRDADYAGSIRRWSYALTVDRINPFFFEDLAEDPANALRVVFSQFLGVGPMSVLADAGPPPGHLDCGLPPEPPPAIAERLAGLHRRQVRDLESLLRDLHRGDLPFSLSERWPG